MQKLPNLNGLRFIAALLVLLYHVDLAMSMNGYKTEAATYFPFNFGAMAVVLFFVLSGFLITWLLLQEKSRQPIAVKEFYLKRVLRIWPLFYLIVAISYFYFNKSDFFAWKNYTDASQAFYNSKAVLILVLLIAPNIALLQSPSLGYANPTWSIGVEEQFYLLWPHIMKRKKPFVYIALIIVLVGSFSMGFLLWLAELLAHGRLIEKGSVIYRALFVGNVFFTFPYSFKIDAMAIGAAGAMVAYYKSPLLENIFRKEVQWIVYALLAILICWFGEHLQYQLYAFLFIMMILNLSLNPGTLIHLEFRWLDYLGKISYGIYIFHSLTIIPSIKLSVYITGSSGSLFTEVLACFCSTIFTIAVAALSYSYFERYFLSIKDRLARNSGSAVNV